MSGAKPKLLDTLKLDAGWSHELLLYDNRLLVLSRGGYWAEPLPAMAARMMPYAPVAVRPGRGRRVRSRSLRLVRTLTIDGAYVAARLVGGTARIVATSQVPETLPFVQPTSSTAAALAARATHNRQVSRRPRVANWLPSYRIKRAGAAATKARPLVQCRNVRRPRRSRASAC